MIRNCEATVETSLHSEDGIVAVLFQNLEKLGVVVKDFVDPKKLENLIEDIGYQAKIIPLLEMEESQKKAIFEVDGMTCGSCVAIIENYMGNQEGIQSCKVSLLAKKAEVHFDPNLLNEEAIKANFY